ncbi:MAG: ATPase, T2SS/T4P/T4SS family, partial [Vicinamibacterales bacterium]
ESEGAAESSHEAHVDVEAMLIAEAAATEDSSVSAEPEPAPALTPAEEALKAARAAFMAAQTQSADGTEEIVSSGSAFESPQEPAVEQAMTGPPAEEVGAIAHPEPAVPMSIAHVSEDIHPVDTAAEASPAVAPEFAATAEEKPTQPSEPAFAAAVPEEPSMPDDSRQDLSTDDTPLVLEPAASVESDAPAAGGQEQEDAAPARHAAVVLPLTRQSRGDGSSDARGGVSATLQRLLRLAASRGAVTVYAVAQSAPMVRIDGEFSVLEGEPTLSTAFIEKLLAELAPPSREGAAAAAEWIAEVPEVGRVRCVTFRDHRGPGVIFRMVPPRAISAEQLGLPAEVQALCTEADGLVLVAGGRGSGRSTLLTSFVDLLNRTRSDYLITLESQIEFVHESKRSFISQREVPGNGDALAAAVRAAVREEPDVLIIEDLRTPELMALALEAAESGRLVFGSVPAPSAVVAVERILEMFPVERREKTQATLASTLRGVVSQVLLRRLKGGRVPAREVLINTPAIAALIHEGKTSQLSAALENGRRYGMMPLAESLAALVRDGVVHPSHAQRKAPDKDQLVSVLRRDGIDTAVVERLA